MPNLTLTGVRAGATTTGRTGRLGFAPLTLTGTRATAATITSVGSSVQGRALIALADGPLEPNPTWTRLDDTPNLVAGIDIHRGRQTERDSTDTGTATLYLNDTAGLFDNQNFASPFTLAGMDGRQVMFQAFNPVTQEWVTQFRGFIDDWGYVIDPSEVVANVQVDCVDIFDYLGGYQIQPGVNGDTPPAGSEGTVFYEDTAGTVDDRIIQALTETGIDSSMWVVFTGNVSVQETKYDPGDAMLNVLRDAADAELPMIANIYVDKLGRFVFHGRYSRFDPDTTAASASAGAWNFRRWRAGDSAAIAQDPTTAQMRVLEFSRARSEIINSAICYPRGIAEKDMSGQVFEHATSIGLYGKHSWSAPDLIVKAGITTGNTANQECAAYAELTVMNQKYPINRVSAITIKPVPPADSRASVTWELITGADISDIVTVAVLYPGSIGVGEHDSFVEGVTMRIRPLNTHYDSVELDLDLSPVEWSQDMFGPF